FWLEVRYGAFEGVDTVRVANSSSGLFSRKAVNGRNGNHNGSGSLHKGVHSEHDFRQMLCRERKRSERSRKHLLLALFDGKEMNRTDSNADLLQRVAAYIGTRVRDTDFAGWYETDTIFGIIFTELGETDITKAMSVIQQKITQSLQKAFKPAELNKVLV